MNSIRVMPMQILQIADPSRCAYPFSKELYEDPVIVYHGTQSAFIESIERDGLQTAAAPFDRTAFVSIVNAYEEMGLGGQDATLLKTYALSIKSDRAIGRAIYFSQRFWHALEYAECVGGEAVNNALKAAAVFQDFCASSTRRKALVEFHQDQVRLAEEQGQSGYAEKSKKQLECIRDESRIRLLCAEVGSIERKLRHSVSGSYPVVYAVRVAREWFEEWEDPQNDCGMCQADNNMACQHGVAPEHLMARADYVNGREPDTVGVSCHSHIAREWEDARGI